jgi:hypothetical protein
MMSDAHRVFHKPSSPTARLEEICVSVDQTHASFTSTPNTLPHLSLHCSISPQPQDISQEISRLFIKSPPPLSAGRP